MAPTDLKPGCPVRTALELLGGKWRLLIVQVLRDGPMRFGDLRRALAPISEKVLAGELSAMAIDELVIRTDFETVPPRVEYHLSEKGILALPVIAQLRAFGEAYGQMIGVKQPSN